MSTDERKEIVLNGIAASPGVAHGPAFVFLQRELEIPSYQVSDDKKDYELARFEQAILETRKQINDIRNQVAEKLGEDEARIFDAHLLVLDDKALLEEIVREAEESGLNIEHCVHEVASRYIEAFSRIDDAYIKERVTDIRDVSRRLLQNLMGEAENILARLIEEKVIVAEDLTPSETANLDKGKVLAVITDGGSRTSHSAIMARSVQVPAVVGLHDVTQRVKMDDILLVDGYEGIVIINPTEDSLFRYGKIKIEREQLQQIYDLEAMQTAETLDGETFTLLANIEGNEDPRRVIDCGAEGVGLFRTEALYLKATAFPDEEEQFQVYKHYVESLSPRPVTIRTLDLGGDKNIDHSIFPSDEDNPFMGFRAIRFCLDHPEIFKTQLRAILRSSAFGKVRVMFPMISGLNELIGARKLLEDAKEELMHKSQDYDPRIEVGSMIEIPSAAYTADLLAEHSDFFSIGTNDLIQYMLAVDRVNDRIAHLYEPNHPAVLRTIKHIIDTGKKKGVTISVCGEMAGDPIYSPLLLGLGADELSITPSTVPEIKYLVRKMKISEARTMAEEVLALAEPKAIFDRLRSFYLGHMDEG